MKKLSLALIILIATSTLWAQGMGGRGMGQGRMGDCTYAEEKLNLTDEQKIQLQDLRVKHQKDVIPLQADLKVKQIELREMIVKGESEKNLLKKNSEIDQIKAKLSELRLKQKLQVKNVVGEENFKLMGAGMRGRGMAGDCMAAPGDRSMRIEKRIKYKK